MSYLGYLGFKTGQRTSIIGDDDEMLPWEPVDAWAPEAVLGSAITNWWNADDTSLMVDQGGGFTSSFTDRVGGLAVTATGSARPLWLPTGLNGLPGFSFNGTSQCFATTDLTTIPTGTTPSEIWAVVRQDAPNADTGTRYAVAYGTFTSAQNRGVFRDRSTQVSVLRANDGSGGIIYPIATYIFNGLCIVRARWLGGTDERVSPLGAAESTAVITSLNTVATRLRIGGSNGTSAALFWLGAIRHIAITTTLTDAQADGLFRWFAWDAGILSSLLSANKTRP